MSVEGQPGYRMPSLGSILGALSLIGVFLGAIPGSRWAVSYYSTIGTPSVAVDITWRELVAPSLICGLGLVAGTAFSALSIVFYSRWPLAAPWRLSEGRRLRWFPGALIAILTCVAFLAVLASVWNSSSQGTLASGFVALAIVSGLVWMILVVPVGSLLGPVDRPFPDPLITKVEAVRFYAEPISAGSTSVSRGAERFRAGNMSFLRAGAFATFASALVLATMNLFAFSWSQMQNPYFGYFVANTFGLILALWFGRNIWDVAVHGITAPEAGEPFDRTPVDHPTQTLDEIRSEVMAAGDRYAFVRGAMLERLDASIERHGGQQSVELPSTSTAKRVWGTVAIVGLAIMTVFLTIGAGVIGERQALELRQIILDDDEPCSSSGGSEFLPFDPITAGFVRAEFLDWRDIDGNVESECVWNLRATSERVWIATALDGSTIEVRPIPIERIERVRTFVAPDEEGDS